MSRSIKVRNEWQRQMIAKYYPKLDLDSMPFRVYNTVCRTIDQLIEDEKQAKRRLAIAERALRPGLLCELRRESRLYLIRSISSDENVILAGRRGNFDPASLRTDIGPLFCLICGKQTDRMELVDYACPACRDREIPLENRFCPACGQEETIFSYLIQREQEALPDLLDKLAEEQRSSGLVLAVQCLAERTQSLRESLRAEWSSWRGHKRCPNYLKWR